ncbi:winged helix-turn-helix transcriptional regulator [Nocardioides cavernaquae]|uniref:Transcriptional regulator n=1 Tax=Nocardioides cavernaquae TaxID=2321396 RepID=A0A3A5HAT6_9ACTN|nr:helix-turn-helix domain-containing protein [Nocardioides cavernaquae]RJS45150.1 transcriptional regulator [Nocardioides cavernaquae]
MTTPASERAADRPSALDYRTDNCPIGRTMEIFGERWTLVVVREVFNGVRRFDDMRLRTPIPRQVLTDRLRLLVDHGILEKVPYQVTGQRPRHEYRLTTKGIDLYPVLVTVAAWGNKHLPDPDGAAVEFAHRECGGLVQVELTCDKGHTLEQARNVVAQPGPGAKLREPA